MTVDPFNRGKHHAAVVVISLILAAILWAMGIPIPRIVAAIAWFLLFFVMVIGPLTKLWPSINTRFTGNFPLNWRSELGIWFVIWSLVHVVTVFDSLGWDIVGFFDDMAAAVLAAVVALIIAFILALTSNNAAFQFLGSKAWKWHQSHGTYVLFWLLVVHIYEQIFLRYGLPTEDPLHLLYLATIAIVVVLHVGAFIKVVVHYRRHDQYPGSI